jgi:tRNA (cmo5U34)-methyltransferase
MPPGRWAFDGAVTAAFDDMLRRSIPQYEVMREAAFEVGCRFVAPGADVLDLGCSRGEALAPFVDRFGAQNRFVGVDVSEPMLAAARARYEGYARAGVVDIRRCDLRAEYPPVSACLTLCILTLQFTPIEYRPRIVRDIYRHTRGGGALVLVEKVLGGGAEADACLTEAYLRHKAARGYSAEEIDRKRLSLEGVLVPVTARWNEDLLASAGFRHVECFWRWMNFAGWLAVREGAGP